METVNSQIAPPEAERWSSYFKHCENRFVLFWMQYIDDHSVKYHILDIDIDNILNALESALTLGLNEAFVTGAISLSPYMNTRGLYRQIEHCLGQARDIAHLQNNQSLLKKTAFHLSETLINQGKLEQAEELVSKLLLQESEPSLLKAKLQRNLGSIALYKWDFEEAKTYYDLALETSQMIPDREQTSHILSNLAVLNFQQENYQAAMDYSTRALMLARQGNYAEAIARATGNLAMAYYKLRDYAKAQECYEETLQMFDEIGNPRQVAITWDNLGLLYEKIGWFAQAKPLFEKALTLYRKIGGDLEMQGFIIEHLGLLAISMSDGQAGVTYNQRALSISRQLGNELGGSLPLTQWAQSLIILSRFEEAIPLLEEAVRIREAYNQETLTHVSRIYLANALLHSNKTKKAKEMINQVMEWIEKTQPNITDDVLPECLVCYRTLLRLGDKRASHFLHTLYTSLQAQALLISDTSIRHSFLTNVPVHAEIISLWEQTKTR